MTKQCATTNNTTNSQNVTFTIQNTTFYSLFLAEFLLDKVQSRSMLLFHDKVVKNNTIPLQFETALNGAFATWHF